MSYRDNFLKENKSNYGWYTCTYCGAKIRKSELDVDHKHPKAQGGSNDTSNLVPSCPRCNRSKGGLTPGEYADREFDKEDESTERYLRNCKKYGDDVALEMELKREGLI